MNKLEISFNLGFKAFNEGKKCIPSFDSEFNQQILSNCKNFQGTIYCNKWEGGWLEAKYEKIDKYIID